MLIVFGGLPGSGKTTIACAIAAARAALYLRIDTIEQAIRDAGVLAGNIGPAGYAVAMAVAETNLAVGRIVVADCVNPIAVTRDAWRDVAARAQARLVEIEVVCSNRAEHRRRVEQRVSDIPGLVLPAWQDVLERDYAAWDEPHIVIDTAALTQAQAIAETASQIFQCQIF